METKEKYVPSSEEVKKAEEMMTDEQKEQSEKREEIMTDEQKKKSEQVNEILTEKITSFETGEVDPYKVQNTIQSFIEAVKENIVISDSEQKIKKLAKAIKNIDSYYKFNFVNYISQKLLHLENLINKGGEKPEGIEGKGLEFSSTNSGVRQAYLDGELIGSIDNATFSEKATNGEVVSWQVSDVIDQNPNYGTQNRYRIYAWKKGWEKPKEIFEDHAWSNEKRLRIYAPEVASDGTITVEVQKDETKETMKLTA